MFVSVALGVPTVYINIYKYLCLLFLWKFFSNFGCRTLLVAEWARAFAIALKKVVW